MKAVASKEDAGKFIFRNEEIGTRYVGTRDSNHDYTDSEQIVVHYIYGIECVNSLNGDGRYFISGADGEAPYGAEDPYDTPRTIYSGAPEGTTPPNVIHLNRFALFRLMPVEPSYAYVVNCKYQDAKNDFIHSGSIPLSTYEWDNETFSPETDFDFFTFDESAEHITFAGENRHDFTADDPLVINFTSNWPFTFTQDIEEGAAEFPDGTAWHMLNANDDNSKWARQEGASVADFKDYFVGKGNLWAFKWVDWPNFIEVYNLQTGKPVAMNLKEGAFKYVDKATGNVWWRYNGYTPSFSEPGDESGKAVVKPRILAQEQDMEGSFYLTVLDQDDRGEYTYDAHLGYNDQTGTMEVGYRDQSISNVEGGHQMTTQRAAWHASAPQADQMLADAASLHNPAKVMDNRRFVGAYEATDEDIEAYKDAVSAYTAAPKVVANEAGVIDEFLNLYEKRINLTANGLYRIVSHDAGDTKFLNVAPIAKVNGAYFVFDEAYNGEQLRGITANTSKDYAEGKTHTYNVYESVWRFEPNTAGAALAAPLTAYYDTETTPDVPLWKLRQGGSDLLPTHANTGLHMGSPAEPTSLVTGDYDKWKGVYGIYNPAEGDSDSWYFKEEKNNTYLTLNDGGNAWSSPSEANSWHIEEVTEFPFTLPADDVYSSVHLPFPYVLPEGYTAYTGQVSGNVVELTSIDVIVPAFTPVLIGGPGGLAKLTANTSEEAWALSPVESSFVGTTGRRVGFAPGTVYAYAKGYSDIDGSEIPGYHFFKNASSVNTIPSNKLYIPADKAQAVSMLLLGDGTVTHVDAPALAPQGKTESWYDLAGRKVAAPKHGVFVNEKGQKVMIK